MNMNELCTIVTYGRITIFIFNNSVLGMVRQWQTYFYNKRYSALRLTGKRIMSNSRKRSAEVPHRNHGRHAARARQGIRAKGPCVVDCWMTATKSVPISVGKTVDEIILE